MYASDRVVSYHCHVLSSHVRYNTHSSALHGHAGTMIWYDFRYQGIGAVSSSIYFLLVISGFGMGRDADAM